MFDLLIQGGTVYAPETGALTRQDVAVAGGRIARLGGDLPASGAQTVLDASDCLVTPGLIDLHCHIYPVFPYVREDSLRTVNAEEHMLRCGVTTAVDAGTCGWRNFGDFYEHVVSRTKLRVLAFLNIAAKGMAYTDSEQAVADIQPSVTAAVAKAYDDCVVGVKSAHYWPRPQDASHPAFASIDGAREAAAQCGKPVMVDSIPVSPQRTYPDILRRLSPGDIHTHVFAQQFPLLDGEGRVQAFLMQQRARGVRFDVGHGSGSFWFRQAVPCLEQGFWPDTLSTDLHHQNVTGPAFDLLYVAGKFLAMGMPLGDVLYRVTRAPALVLGREELGVVSPGACADLAVLRLRPGRFGYLDCGGARLQGEGKLECVATVRAGETLYDPEGRTAPDWRCAPPPYWTPPGLMRSWELRTEKEESPCV